MTNLYAKALPAGPKKKLLPPQVLHLRGPGLLPAGEGLRLEALRKMERGGASGWKVSSLGG